MHCQRFLRRLLLTVPTGFAILLATAPLATASALPSARCCRSRSSGRASYGGGHHSGSHGGHYSAGTGGSSHKGGHYHSPSGGTH